MKVRVLSVSQRSVHMATCRCIDPSHHPHKQVADGRLLVEFESEHGQRFDLFMPPSDVQYTLNVGCWYTLDFTIANPPEEK